MRWRAHDKVKHKFYNYYFFKENISFTIVTHKISVVKYVI